MIRAKRFGHVTLETSDIERQVAYFTEVAGLVLAERENGRAYLATKLGDLVVQLETGEQARCRRLAFQVAPDLDFNDIRSGIEAEGLRCQSRNDPAPGIAQMLSFEDPKGTVCEIFRGPDADLQAASRRRNRAAQARPSGLRRSGPAATCRFLRQGSRLSRLGLDRRLVCLHALRSGSPHHQLRARQAHADAPRRF